ncbi:MAG TPA: PQQ-binding-like beta-propeller repeat protein, partial [Chthoniobacteraceae bacterium]|nr:PQQ-binding-like beta-propeller repeat protein [Chthoniobacteraceae bacterium]
PAALAILCASAFADDWSQFMGPHRDQTSAETGLMDTFPKAGPKLVFEKQVGTGYSAPSIRGEVMVVHHRIGDQEIVEACSAATGAAIWKHAYPSSYRDPFGYNNGPRCTPLLTADRCYTYGAEGVLACLDLKDGRVIWFRATLKDFQVPESFFGVGSSPILEDGMIIAQVGGQPDSGVAAFDANTGATVWQNVGEKTWTGVPMTGWPGERTVVWSRADPAFEKQASYCTPVAATIHGQRQLLVVTRQGLVSLDPKKGAHRFSFWFRARQDSSVNAMTPVVDGDLILISSAYFKNGSVLLRVRPDGSGVDEVWRSLALEMHWTRPVLTGGHLYAFSGRNEPDAHFRCVEFATGKVKWDRDEGWPNAGHARLAAGEAPPNVFGRGSAILADGKLIALGEAGLLGLFKPNAEKLEELSRWQAPKLAYPCWAAPVLANGWLYLRDEKWVVCYDLRR